MIEAMDNLVSRVERTILAEGMFGPGSGLVVGVSGGADSTALLTVLAELSGAWRLKLVAAHLNHGLRGRESDADEAHARRLADRLGLPLAVKRVEAAGPNLEARARELRYAFLFATAREQGAEQAAVGHQGDDAIETLLINLVRGAGAAGLSGIAPTRELAIGGVRGRVVRPLIRLRRSELEAWLKRRGLAWREDSTNRSPHFLRNRIRHQLIPLLESFNPSIFETLTRTAEISRREAELLESQARTWLARSRKPGPDPAALSVADLRALPPALRMAIYREAIREQKKSLSHISRAHLSAVDGLVMSGPIHGSLDLPGIKARKEYYKLEMRPFPEPAGVSAASGSPELPLVLAWPGQVTFPGPGGVSYRITAELTSRDDASEEAGLWIKVDPEKIAGELVIRTRRPGDRYQPSGLVGRRKVKKILNELRVPPAFREQWPVFADRQGLIWIPGARPAERVKPGPGARQTLQLSIHPSLPLPADHKK